MGGELCRRSEASGRFYRNRRAGKARRALVPRTIFLKAPDGVLAPATEKDKKRRRNEQFERYLQHLNSGTLTPEWEKFGRKHMSEIAVFSAKK